MKKIALLFMLLCAMTAYGQETCTSSVSSVIENWRKGLSFTAVDGKGSVSLTKVGNPQDVSLVYSTDSCLTWKTYEIGKRIRLKRGERVYLRAASSNYTFSGTRKRTCKRMSRPAYYRRYRRNRKISYFKFAMSGTISSDGNVMSLLDESMDVRRVPDRCFYRLFDGCVSLIKAPELPAVSVGYQGYAMMFYGCHSLQQAPELPARSIDYGSYFSMFANCSSITQVPELPADTLYDECYMYMFTNCKALKVNLECPGAVWKIKREAVPEEDDTDWGDSMFEYTGGTLQGTPEIGRAYHIVDLTTGK